MYVHGEEFSGVIRGSIKKCRIGEENQVTSKQTNHHDS